MVKKSGKICIYTGCSFGRWAPSERLPTAQCTHSYPAGACLNSLIILGVPLYYIVSSSYFSSTAFRTLIIPYCPLFSESKFTLSRAVQKLLLNLSSLICRSKYHGCSTCAQTCDLFSNILFYIDIYYVMQIRGAERPLPPPPIIL